MDRTARPFVVVSALASALVLTFVLVHAHAESQTQPNSWPTKPVRIVAPFAAGGAADTLGRIVADPLSGIFRQQFYVENRVGAGGLIGAASVAAAAPDGYTFVVSGVASHVIAPALSPNPGFDALRDFSHVAYLGGPPVVIIVHPSLAVASYRDLIAYAKRSPRALDYISPGTGTHGFLFAENLARREGIKLTHIPYKGAGPALMDLVGGHVPIGSITFSSAAAQIRSRAVRALAVSSENRLPNFPDIPTFKEMGYGDLVAETWFALSGPARLPADIVRSLSGAIGDILRRPEVQARMAQDEIEIRDMSPEQVTTHITQEIARWSPLAKSLNLTIE
jgi:tripartite-type tricarboxylate transporter receptor subunit TctC